MIGCDGLSGMGGGNGVFLWCCWGDYRWCGQFAVVFCLPSDCDDVCVVMGFLFL